MFPFPFFPLRLFLLLPVILFSSSSSSSSSSSQLFSFSSYLLSFFAILSFLSNLRHHFLPYFFCRFSLKSHIFFFLFIRTVLFYTRSVSLLSPQYPLPPPDAPRISCVAPLPSSVSGAERYCVVKCEICHWEVNND